MAEKQIETYRGVAIERTAEVLGFQVRPEHWCCVGLRYRREDDAPILDMFPTIEECRAEIDEHLAESAS